MCDNEKVISANNDDGQTSCEVASLTPAPADVWIKTEYTSEEIQIELEPCSEDFSSEEKALDNVKLEPAEDESANGDADLKYACEECGRRFLSETALALHRRRHSPDNTEGKFECQFCHKSYTKVKNFIRHQKELCNARPCPICHKEFKVLRSHMTTHTNARPYKCDLCGHLFKHSSALARHKDRHKGVPKPFVCAECGKAFPVVNALECHARTHTQERPFACAICLRAFTHKHNMLRHMQRHARVVHLKCEVCNKEFPRESRLKYHMRVHWQDNKPYKCGHCHKSYSHQQNITRHYKKKHPHVEYISPNTDAEIANKGWAMRLAQLGERDPSDAYILPETSDCVTQQPPDDEEVLVKPEVVILDSSFKQEV